MANLNISDDKKEIIEGQKNEEEGEEEYELCLVGRHFPSMRRTLAKLWHPMSEIFITDIGEKRNLFRFYHEIDIKRLLRGTFWFLTGI